MSARRGRPPGTGKNQMALRFERIEASSDGCKWTRADGRVLHMPWTVDLLWARLCQELAHSGLGGGQKQIGGR